MSSSPTLAANVKNESRPASIAPAWHTAAVLIVFLALSLIGALGLDRTLSERAHGRIFSYLLVMAIEWGMAAFIYYGVRRRGVRIADLVGGSWLRAKDVFCDLGIAVGFLLVSSIVLNGIGHLLRASTNDAIRKALPHGIFEDILWIGVSLTAGFCEELIFRGYLQRQFSVLTRSLAGGIVLQGIAFGLAHGYQGWKLMLLISIFGCMFGGLAHWRRSLRPGMLAHFLQDGVGGLLGSRLMH